MVLGVVGVVVGFAILAQDRDLALDVVGHAASGRRRTPGSRSTSPIGLVAMQCVVLLVSLGVFFVAVSFDLVLAAAIGTALAILAVLVGVAIDVNHASVRGDARGRTSIEGYESIRKL